MGNHNKLGQVEGTVVSLIDEQIVCEAGERTRRVTLLVAGEEERIDGFTPNCPLVVLVPDHAPSHAQIETNGVTRLMTRRYRAVSNGIEVRAGQWILHVVLAEHFPVPSSAEGKTALVWEVRE